MDTALAPALAAQTKRLFSVDEVRKDFPILQEQVNGLPLVYLDNAATTQKPNLVLDAIQEYYRHFNANIHRGLHSLADRATAEFESTREHIRTFLNAESKDQIIFTTGTTGGINLIAGSYGRRFLQPGDEVVVSAMEHHSNIVPWQLICEERGASLKVIPMSDEGVLDMEAARQLISSGNVKIVSVVWASNSLGTVNPIAEIIKLAHEAGAVAVIDGAQSTSHFHVDVQALDADFYVFSSHKIFGPTGMGVVYGKRHLLEAMPPYQGGGEMIRDVTFERSTWNDIPYKFEAGTPNIADVVAFRMALQYLESFNREDIARHENALLSHATGLLLEKIPGARVIGQSPDKISVLSFVVAGAHHQDIGILLDQYGIAVRTGHHCTQPVMDRLGIPGTVRASFSPYNTLEEVEFFIEKLARVVKMAS